MRQVSACSGPSCAAPTLPSTAGSPPGSDMERPMCCHDANVISGVRPSTSATCHHMGRPPHVKGKKRADVTYQHTDVQHSANTFQEVPCAPNALTIIRLFPAWVDQAGDIQTMSTHGAHTTPPTGGSRVINPPPCTTPTCTTLLEAPRQCYGNLMCC
jgi:hypothetical protein